MPEIDPKICWPGWETVRLIGRGSFGAVYEIRRTLFGETERCALKHISIPQTDSEVRDLRGEGLDEESITRSFNDQARDIVREYRMMMRLNDCPSVVNCYDVNYIQKDSGYGGDIFIRMELLTPLMELLGQRQGLSEAEILRLGKDIAAALCACARLHIVHRDVKPQNIFVASDGRCKLGDFGIARVSERTGSATARIGTFNYMAPEVYKGERYGAAADVYSLGMVLYWLLNERRGPFVRVNTASEKDAALLRRMSGEPIPAPAHGSEALKRVVLRACAYDPKERCRSAEELLRELEAVNHSEFRKRNSEWRQEQTVAPVGATFGRPPVAPAGPQTGSDKNGLLRATAPTSADKTVGMFNRPAVASKATTADNTVGAGLAPARGRGQTTEPPGGASPSHPAEDGDKTRGLHDRRVPEPAPGPVPKAKKGKRRGLLLAVCALAAVLVGLLILKTAQDRRAEAAERARQDRLEAETEAAYENALALLENGQYEEAIAAFEALGDYEDSAERLLQARYGRAQALADSGESYAAARAFYALKDYRDSRDRCFALWGQITQRETLSAGYAHTVGLRADSTVLAVGWNNRGQCEVSGWTDVVAVSAGGWHTVGLRSDGKVVTAGWNYHDQCEVSGWTDIVAVSAGNCHTVGLRADGTVLAVGWNDYGQCEVSGWTDVVAVSAGGAHTVGLRADGTVLAVGDTRYGQCEVSGWTDMVAVSAGDYHTVGLRADGTVVATGDNGEGQCEVSGWTDIIAISAGGWHTVGLRADGTVVAVGWNDDGQCKVGSWRLALPVRQARN